MYNYREDLFEQLYNLIEKSTYHWVYDKLNENGIYTTDNRDTVLQEARLGVKKNLEKSNSTGIVQPHYISYAYGIYKKKTSTLILKELPKKMIWYSTESLNEPKPDDNYSKDEKIGEEIENLELLAEIKKLYIDLFKVYCRALGESDEYPHVLLGFFFARVLPHMLEVIPETKQASAKWAHDFMKGKTIDELADVSENIIRDSVDESFRWGTIFRENLEKAPEDMKSADIIKDLIYTDIYDKKEISHFADATHRKIAIAAHLLLVEDQRLFDLAKNYIEKGAKSYILVDGGRKK